MEEHEERVLHFWKNITMFFVLFPKRLTHILSKLILIFFPFLCIPFLSFLFFSCIFLASKPKKFSFTNPKNFHTLKRKPSNPNTTLSNQFPSLLNLKPSSLFQNSHKSFKLHGRPPLLIATTANTTTYSGSLLFFL